MSHIVPPARLDCVSRLARASRLIQGRAPGTVGTMPSASKKCVYAVHGFMGSPWEFLLLSRHLRHLGYEVRPRGHTSVTRPTREYAAMLAADVESAFASSSFGRVHMLGRGMGGSSCGEH